MYMTNTKLVFGIGMIAGAITVIMFVSFIGPAMAQGDEEDDITTVGFDNDFFELTVDSEYSVDVGVNTPSFDVSFTDINPDTGLEGIDASSDALGEEEADAAQTGLCAVGFGADDSPLPFGVDDSGDISSEEEIDGPADTQTPADVVEECTEHSIDD